MQSGEGGEKEEEEEEEEEEKEKKKKMDLPGQTAPLESFVPQATRAPEVPSVCLRLRALLTTMPIDLNLDVSLLCMGSGKAVEHIFTHCPLSLGL